MHPKIKYMMIASIGVSLSIASIQVSASRSSGNPDRGMPRRMCFHINPVPNHPDPLGSYIVLGFKTERQVSLEERPIRLVSAHGIGIGRAPILPVGFPTMPAEWGDWVGSPISGTCHKHRDKYQCSLQSTSAITIPFPEIPPIGVGWSIETAQGDIALVHHLSSSETILSQTGSIDVAYFDPAGTPILDSDPLLSGLGLKTFKKIEHFVSGKAIYVVNCKNVPHPEIPSFFIP
ncbi:MAG: hypothetical protein V3V22_03605 [Methylococcales bacterium]